MLRVHYQKSTADKLFKELITFIGSRMRGTNVVHWPRHVAAAAAAQSRQVHPSMPLSIIIVLQTTTKDLEVPPSQRNNFTT